MGTGNNRTITKTRRKTRYEGIALYVLGLSFADTMKETSIRLRQISCVPGTSSSSRTARDPKICQDLAKTTALSAQNGSTQRRLSKRTSAASHTNAGDSPPSFPHYCHCGLLNLLMRHDRAKQLREEPDPDPRRIPGAQTTSQSIGQCYDTQSAHVAHMELDM